MNFGKILFLTVTLSSLFLGNAGRPQANNLQARVTRLCKGTTNPNLCVQTILPQLRGPFNPYKALQAEILATQNQIKKTAGAIGNLAANPRNSKQLSDSYGTCKEQYNMMLDSIDKSLKAVAQRNVIEARFKFSSVLSYRSTCEDEFKGRPPFAGDSNVVYQLGGNCLDIMKVIADKENNRNGKRVPKTLPVQLPPNLCQNVIGPCDMN